MALYPIFISNASGDIFPIESLGEGGTGQTMQLRVDREANALVVTPDMADQETRNATTEGTIDVGADGALLGIEIRGSAMWTILARQFAGWGSAVTVDEGAAYVSLMPGDDRNARSAEIEIGVGLDEQGHVARLSVPRRGTGYEITYPSGNR